MSGLETGLRLGQYQRRNSVKGIAISIRVRVMTFQIGSRIETIHLVIQPMLGWRQSSIIILQKFANWGEAGKRRF